MKRKGKDGQLKQVPCPESGDAAEEAKVNKDTAGAVYQWLREICSTALIRQRIELGGPGTVVQIDESLFKHNPR